MGFALRYGPRDYPLGEGRFLIGRSESCQLCVDDPLASRNHAAIVVTGDAVQVEDLQSRNGVFVNKERISSQAVLKHGDQIRVGSQEMTLVRRGLARAETLAQSPVTQRLQAFGILGGLADKALAMGHGEEAERILGRQLDSLVEKAERGEGLDDEPFDRAVRYAMRIGALTRKGRWLDYLFRLFAAHERLMDADMVNELYSLAPKMPGATRAHLRAYVAVLLEDGESTYSPGERFVIKRLEGLEALLH